MSDGSPTESSNDLSVLLHRAATRLRAGEYALAELLLRPVAASDESGRAAALLGDALFLQSRYDDAAAQYEAALGRAPEARDWRERAAQAVENARAAVDATIPPLERFTRHLVPEALAAGPSHSEPELGPPLELPQRHGMAAAAHGAEEVVGSALGAIGGRTLEALSEAFGRGKISDELWTNWYHDLPGVPETLDEAISIFKLAFMRKELFEHNLITTYPDGAPTGFYRDGAGGPPAWALRARTEDGSWNWLPRDEEGRRVTGPDPRHDPLVGAAFTRFYRNVGDDQGLEATRPVAHPGTEPANVLTVSHTLLTRDGPLKEIPFLNIIAASWIQFQNHDWVSHGDNRSDLVDHVPIPEGHPARERFHVETMPVHRSWPDASRHAADGDRPPTYLNEVTHWWDGSQVYGSDRATVRKLRCQPAEAGGALLPDGKLYIEADRLLPVDPETGIESTGFQRNWWVGLSMLHTLFVQEHNRICEMLRGHYPSMPGDEVFLKARMINAAVMAKIHTVEWTPALLPNPALYKGMRANWFGLVTDLFHHQRHPRAIEEIRVRSKELGGILGNPVGSAMKYALSEEFVAVYRLHSLLPDTIRVRMGVPGQTTGEEVISLGSTRLRAARQTMAKYSPAALWASFGAAHPGQLVLHNYPSQLQNLSLPGLPFQDLGALDVYRDRERGVPPYNQLRRELGLKPIHSFDDLNPDPEIARQLRQVYGQTAGKDNVDSIDLLIGTLGEGFRPTGFGFGETLFQVFILNASWRLLGDRFYTDDYRPEIYTPEGLAWVDEADLKRVLLRNHPELEHTGLGNIANAFEPWDEGQLDAARHPIRQWDTSIEGDCWAGERAAT